jgi:predicted TIM-barrel fold metal-dependent hydrolase
MSFPPGRCGLRFGGVRVVDCLVHLHSRTYLEAHVGRHDPPLAERRGDGYLFHRDRTASEAILPSFLELDVQLDELDAQGVDVAVSSFGAFSVDHLPVPQATELAMHLNHERAELERSFPGRFYGLALLPMQDAQAAIETLEHAVRTLSLRGVCVPSIVAPPHEQSARRLVYQRIGDLGVPLFVRSAPRATIQHVLAGAPGLTVVAPRRGDRLPCLVQWTARRGERALFASGYPYRSAADGLDRICGALSDPELEAVLSLNAIGLLGLN